eukprot:g13115.t1
MDAKANIPNIGLSKRELAAAGGVFENFLRPNRKTKTSTAGAGATIRGPGRIGGRGPRPFISTVEYKFAPGEIALCFDRKWPGSSPDSVNLMTSVLASYPRNPTLLYILREQMENAAREDYGKGPLDVTGPGAFTVALGRHECHRKTVAPRCLHVSPMAGLFHAQGVKARERLHCSSGRSNGGAASTEEGEDAERQPCGDGDTVFAMLTQPLLLGYLMNRSLLHGEQDLEELCSHTRLLQDLPSGSGERVRQHAGERAAVNDVAPASDEKAVSLKNQLAREIWSPTLDHQGLFYPDVNVLNTTKGALFVGWTPKMHAAMKYGGAAESQAGSKVCDADYTHLFDRHKVYCNNLEGGEHGGDDCNVACKDN